MTIEFNWRAFNQRGRMILGLLGTVIGLMGLGLLGRAITPQPARVLIWADWQALKVERRYRAELAALRQAVTDLEAVLEAAPDPIQAGLLHDRLLSQHSNGLPELAVPRAAVLAANEAVYQWAIAAQTREPAVLALQAAVEAIH